MVSVQCPKCELRFSSPNELTSHLREDHRRSSGLRPPDRLDRSREGSREGGRRRRTRLNAAAWFRRR
jgi:hypothetical protein